MATVVVNQGRETSAKITSGVAGAPGAVRSMSVDDSTAAFAVAHTALNSGGAVTNLHVNNFDATPTAAASGNTWIVTHVMTLTTAQYNGNRVRRTAMHNNVAASVTASSNTLFVGIDGLDLLKAATFNLRQSVQVTYA